jgi:hypothetical protein
LKGSAGGFGSGIWQFFYHKFKNLGINYPVAVIKLQHKTAFTVGKKG